jgi:hypothetical protein
MKISEQRIRNFALGILAAIVGYALCACDGGVGSEELDAGVGTDAGRPDTLQTDARSGFDTGAKVDAGNVLVRTDAGVIRCDIPSPTGDTLLVNGHCVASSIIMRDYYEKAAVSGSGGRWGILSNLSDLPTICNMYDKAAACAADSLSPVCTGKTVTVAECNSAPQDFSKYCYVGSCSGNADGINMTCKLGGVMPWTNSFQIDAALCTPQGKFAGWLCSPTRNCT